MATMTRIIERLRTVSGRHLAALALLGAWVVFFARHLFTDGLPYYRDLLLTYHPARQYLHERLWSGELPQWYPYETLGVPFIGQVVTALFHPQTLLFLPFDALTALKLNLLAAYLAASVGAYRMARALGASRGAAVAGGLALAYGGYALGMSNNQPYLLGIATLPWVGWAALRVAERERGKDAALLAIFWALIFLGGDAQMFALVPLLILVAVVVHGLRWRSVLLLGASGVLATLLVGAEFLPATAVSAESARGVGDPSPTLGVTWALAFWRIPEFLISGFVPDEVRFRVVSELFGGGTALWSSSIYAGGIVLLAAAAAVIGAGRRAAALAAVAGLSFWLALGDHAGLLPVAWKLLPVLSKFRFPEKYLALFWVALAVLAALGLDQIRRRPAPWMLAALAGGVLLGIVGIVASGGALVERIWAGRGHVLPSDDPVLPIVSEAWSLGLWSTAGFLLAAGFAIRSSGRPVAFALLPLLVFLELWAGNGAHVPMVPRELIEGETLFGREIRASAQGAQPAARVIPEAVPRFHSTVTLGDGPHWVAGMRHLLRPDASGLSGVTAFGSNLPATSFRDALLLGRKAVRANRFGGDLHGCFRVADTTRPLKEGDQPLYVAEAFEVVLVRQPCLPRAYVAGAQPVEDVWEAARRMESSPLPENTVLWEGGPALAPAEGTVRWLEYAPERLRVEVDLDRAGALVISEAFARGWTATVNGAPAPIHPVNVVARGLALDAGSHVVEMRYRTPLLGWGLASSGLGLLLALGLARWPRMKGEQALAGGETGAKSPAGEQPAKIAAFEGTAPGDTAEAPGGST